MKFKILSINRDMSILLLILEFGDNDSQLLDSEFTVYLLFFKYLENIFNI